MRTLDAIFNRFNVPLSRLMLLITRGLAQILSGDLAVGKNGGALGVLCGNFLDAENPASFNVKKAPELTLRSLIQCYWCREPESNRHGVTTAGF